MLWPNPHLTQKPDCPKAKELLWKAYRALGRGETEAALSLGHAALTLYDRTTNCDGRHRAETLVGDTLMALGAAEQAVEFYRRALDTHLPMDRASAWVKLAEACQASGRPAEAYTAYDQAQRLYRQLAQAALRCKAIYQMAYLRYEQERWTDAETLYRQALALADKTPTDRATHSRILLELGNTLAQTGQLAEAHRLFAQSAAQAGAAGETHILASALHGLGVTYAQAGRHEQALAPYLYSLDLHAEQGDPLAQACTLYELGMNWARLGQPDRAASLLGEAVALYEAHDAPETAWARQGLQSLPN